MSSDFQGSWSPAGDFASVNMASPSEDLLAGVYDHSGEFLLPGRGPSAAEKRLQEENDGCVRWPLT